MAGKREVMERLLQFGSIAQTRESKRAGEGGGGAQFVHGRK